MPTLADIVPPGQPAPDAAQSAQEAAPAPASSLPSPFGDVVAGTVPAVSIPPLHKDAEPDPLQGFVIQNLPELTKSGLDFFEAKDLSTVVFNPEKISEKDLKTADESGKLAEVAPPAQAPAEPAAAAPQEAAAAPAGPAPSLASLPAPKAPVSKQVSRAQLQTLNPRKASPIVANPVPDRLAKRAV